MRGGCCTIARSHARRNESDSVAAALRRGPGAGRAECYSYASSGRLRFQDGISCRLQADGAAAAAALEEAAGAAPLASGQGKQQDAALLVYGDGAAAFRGPRNLKAAVAAARGAIGDLEAGAASAGGSKGAALEFEFLAADG